MGRQMYRSDSKISRQNPAKKESALVFLSEENPARQASEGQRLSLPATQKRDCRTMCDSLQICLVGAVSTNILTPYGVKTAFGGKSGKYCVKFLRNLQIKGGDRIPAAASFLFVGCCKIGILQHPFCGAGYETRTRYLHLGKVALYQMS